MSTESIKDILYFWSSHSQVSLSLKDDLEHFNYPFKEISVDSKEVRSLIKNSKKVKIQFVPTICLVLNNGKVGKVEGASNIVAWLQQSGIEYDPSTRYDSRSHSSQVNKKSKEKFEREDKKKEKKKKKKSKEKSRDSKESSKETPQNTPKEKLQFVSLKDIKKPRPSKEVFPIVPSDLPRIKPRGTRIEAPTGSTSSTGSTGSTRGAAKEIPQISSKEDDSIEFIEPQQDEGIYSDNSSDNLNFIEPDDGYAPIMEPTFSGNHSIGGKPNLKAQMMENIFAKAKEMQEASKETYGYDEDELPRYES